MSRSDTSDQMSSKDTYERISFDIVAAARATFDSGRRTEAIDMLRRFDLGKRRAVVAEALQELLIEHQRLLEQERRAVREIVDEHVKAGQALLESGQLPDAWSHACDAVQLDPTHQDAVAFEARVRKALDDQAGHHVARAQADAQPEAPSPRARPEPARLEPARPEPARAREEAPDRITPPQASSSTTLKLVIGMLIVLFTALALRMC